VEALASVIFMLMDADAGAAQKTQGFAQLSSAHMGAETAKEAKFLYNI
jgi:hypothetical protein